MATPFMVYGRPRTVVCPRPCPVCPTVPAQLTDRDTGLRNSRAGDQYVGEFVLKNPVDSAAKAVMATLDKPQDAMANFSAAATHLADGVDAEEDWVAHGKGKLYCAATGDIYEGWFENDMAHGEGKWAGKDGDEYVGSFVNDKIHGRGTYKSVGGAVYIGEFQDDLAHGMGKSVDPEIGDQYEGAFMYDVAHGIGKLVTDIGDVYEGAFENDVPHGFGKLKLTDGTVFEGFFKDGEYHSPYDMN